MTINYPGEFGSSLPAGFDGVFDWDFLKGCFPRGGMPTDIDGCIEICGRFLLFETKRPGTPIPIGQRRALKAFCDGLPGVSVLFIDGKNSGEFRQAILGHAGERHRFEGDPPEVTQAIQALCRQWSKMVDRGGWHEGLDGRHLLKLGWERMG